jgi:hypothetical protein
MEVTLPSSFCWLEILSALLRVSTCLQWAMTHSVKARPWDKPSVKKVLKYSHIYQVLFGRFLARILLVGK